MQLSESSWMHVSQLTPPESEQLQLISQSEKDHWKVAEPLISDNLGNFLTQDDTSMAGLMDVVDRCKKEGFSAHEVMSMDWNVVPHFFGTAFFRLGDTMFEMGDEWGHLLYVVLQNSGSDPLGHLTLDELMELWPVGIEADLFLNKVSAVRVEQIARSGVVWGV